MKKSFLILLSVCYSIFCFGQGFSYRDSLALESRRKADIVMSQFDSIKGKRILFSIQDKDYCLIFQTDGIYKEYVLTIDSDCNILVIRDVATDKLIEELKANRRLSRKDKKWLKRLQDDVQIRNRAFDISQYSLSLFTYNPSSMLIYGYRECPSYFVIKDEKNQRRGEYFFPLIPADCPYDSFLLMYCLSRIVYVGHYSLERL